MLAQPKVLLISSDAEESDVLERLLHESAILHSASTLAEVNHTLQDGAYDAVLCGRSFHMGAWDLVLDEIRRRCPDLPVIIFCRSAGEREWTEVLDAGGFDLLVAPYQKNTVLPVVEHAVLSYEGRRQHHTAFNEVKTAS